MPSTSASVVRISSAPRSGFTTAASSPMPTRSQGGAGPRRARIAAMRARSPAAGVLAPAPSGVEGLPGKFGRPGFTDDGHLDLAGIFELVLAAPRDVIRQPHGLFIGHAIAFDRDADLAAGLQGEGFRDAGERVRDALELLEPL